MRQGVLFSASSLNKIAKIAFNMHSSKNPDSLLSYQGVYPCPVCRVGQIQAMPLMDAMACECRRHIFTADIERQLLTMPERNPPLTWRWNGRNWTGARLEGLELGWFTWLFAIAFVTVPTTLIGLTAYTFPPNPGSNLSWLPVVWTVLTFLSHLAIVSWLVIEFYQFPVWMYLRAGGQRQLDR